MIYIKLFWNTRIGNWMFQYAHARKLVGVEQTISFYSENPNDREYFMRSMHLLPGTVVVSQIPTGCITVHEFEETEFWQAHSPTDGNYLLDGYFQKVAAFDANFVRTCFRCPSDIRDYLFSKYPVLGDDGLRIGISVRRGDYLALPHLHPFVGEAFLRKAVLQWPGGTVYVVCSDDIPWCRQFFGNEFQDRRFVFVEGESVLAQIYVHTFCHHNVISNSTFSWWGAFLGWKPGKRVVFPTLWFGRSFEYAYPTGLIWEGTELLGNGYTIGMFVRAVLLGWKGELRAAVGRTLRACGFSKMLARRNKTAKTPFKK